MQPQQWRSESVWSGDQPEPGQQWGREEGWRRGGGAHQLWGQGGEMGDYSGSAVAARGFAGDYRGFRGSLAGGFRGSGGSYGGWGDSYRSWDVSPRGYNVWDQKK